MLATSPKILGSYRFRNNSTGNTRFVNMVAGISYQGIYALEGAFDLVRLVFANDTAAPVTINACAIAASAAFNDGLSPVNADGTPASWVLPGFNNLGVDLQFHEQLTGSASSLTIAAAADANNPTLAATDWAVCPSLPRSDLRAANAATGESAGLPLLFVRSFASATARAPAANGTDFSDDASWASVNQGRILRQGAKSGNFVASNQAGFVAPITANGIMPVFAIQFYRRVPGYSVMTIGDSLGLGLRTVANANNYGHQACAALSTPARPVTHINSCAGGFTSLQYTTRGYREIDWLKPDIVCIGAISPNDAGTLTQAEGDLGFARALALANYARGKGAVPILVTGVPYINYSDAAEDAVRNAINNRVRDIGRSGQMLVIDADAAVTDGGNPARPLPELLIGPNGDGAHLADPGHARIAAMAASVISRALDG